MQDGGREQQTCNLGPSTLLTSFNNFVFIFFLAISQLIRMYLTRSAFDIAIDRLLVTFHCVARLGGVSLKQNCVLNIVGGHQNH